ncbi:MAG: hypothetical protein F6K40_06480 [Okeania sp. SIO3I5]|uniref:hypothetical protein n=1 Tax=Okeania sp. SIO3I5 TaxID=2607805 RepID=UPI0013BA6737|nr:hypothetical protein [Okeania sp. SIO3I5]NEQ35951.1 hypothetical protein [Okeania sp. SIO3I5]
MNDQRCHSVKLQKSRGSDRYQSKATFEKQLELSFAKAPRKSSGVKKRLHLGNKSDKVK